MRGIVSREVPTRRRPGNRPQMVSHRPMYCTDVCYQNQRILQAVFWTTGKPFSKVLAVKRLRSLRSRG